jgi:phage tail tape-measure protein
MQLTGAGVPVREILAKSFNITTAELQTMISKGLVPADKAIEAIVSSLEEDFGGAAKRQAGTFSGLISSLSDIKEVGLREFFTGTFQAV